MQRRTKLLVMVLGLAAVLLVTGGVALAAHGIPADNSTGPIHGCYENQNPQETKGALRVVSDPSKCKNNETLIEWLVAGPAVADDDWIISGNNMVAGVSGNVGIGGNNSLSKLYVRSTLGFPNGAIRVEHSGINGMGIFINPIGDTGPSLWANGRGRFDGLVVGSVAGDNVGFNPGSGNLIVANYTQLGLTSGTPPAADCDEASEMGRMKIDDSGGGFLFVCTQTSSGIGWVAK